VDLLDVVARLDLVEAMMGLRKRPFPCWFHWNYNTQNAL